MRLAPPRVRGGLFVYLSPRYNSTFLSQTDSLQSAEEGHLHLFYCLCVLLSGSPLTLSTFCVYTCTSDSRVHCFVGFCFPT